MKLSKTGLAASAGLAILLFCSIPALSQGSAAMPAVVPVAPPAGAPKVKRIDIEALRKLVKPNGKPLVINFWATWCDPCREEFPDLVKLDAAYRGKIDMITISLDDLADKDTYVPKFLMEMKAEMPAYLLKTPDDEAAMRVVSPTWSGNLPFTIIFAPNGSSAYERNGKIRPETVNAEIDKLLAPSKPAP